MDDLREIFGRSRGVFSSLLVISAILPALLFGVLSKDKFGFLTKADSPAMLRIWIEPENIVSKVGDVVRFSVYGEYDHDLRTIPQVKFFAHAPTGLTSKETMPIVYNKEFRGQVQLGTVSFVAEKNGDYVVDIPKEKIDTLISDLPIVSTGAIVTVR